MRAENLNANMQTSVSSLITIFVTETVMKEYEMYRNLWLIPHFCCQQIDRNCVVPYVFPFYAHYISFKTKKMTARVEAFQSGYLTRRALASRRHWELYVMTTLSIYTTWRGKAVTTDTIEWRHRTPSCHINCALTNGCSKDGVTCAAWRVEQRSSGSTGQVESTCCQRYGSDGWNNVSITASPLVARLGPTVRCTSQHITNFERSSRWNHRHWTWTVWILHRYSYFC